MPEDTKQLVKKIANLTELSVGPSEENVKQKIIVPLLVLLGHNREGLEFEYPTRHRRGKIDIFIKDVPSDCKVIIDTKNYTESLDDHIEQIKEYTFDESALLAVIANGTEIRVYSPLRGVDFERSLLLSVKRQHLANDSVWVKLSELLHKDNLQNRTVYNVIERREKEIKEALTTEEHLKEEYTHKIETVKSKIETKEEEINQLSEEKESLIKKQESEIEKTWSLIDLPSNLSKIPMYPRYPKSLTTGKSSKNSLKAGRVVLQELENAQLLKNGQILYFYHTRLFKDEKAEIMSQSNKLKYLKDGRIYSISELAKILLIEHGFKRDQHGVAGPDYWKTENGTLLKSLNEEIRKKRGDRK